jgi:hypothetical protein
VVEDFEGTSVMEKNGCLGYLAEDDEAVAYLDDDPSKVLDRAYIGQEEHRKEGTIL